MKIILDRRSPKPLYLQISDCIRRLIESEALQLREKLPSIRSLAESLQINKLKIIEAYNVLEPDKRVRQSAGYFVKSLVRKTLSFSKKLANHIGAIWYFIHHYNELLRLYTYLSLLIQDYQSSYLMSIAIVSTAIALSARLDLLL